MKRTPEAVAEDAATPEEEMKTAATKSEETPSAAQEENADAAPKDETLPAGEESALVKTANAEEAHSPMIDTTSPSATAT